MSTKKRPGSLTTKYKKQHGIHHKHNDRYLKVYWPYLPVLLLVFTGIIASIVILLNKPNTTLATASISQTTLLNDTNLARSKNNLNPVQLDAQLSTAAQIKANDMALHNYWSPISPNGQTPWKIISQVGYQYQTAGENLAFGFSNSQSVLNAWMSSSSHRQNILSSSFQNVGFGIAQSPNFKGSGPQTIVVAVYASPVGTPVKQSPNSGFTTASLTTPTNQNISLVESLTSKNNLMAIFIVGAGLGIIGTFLIFKHGKVVKKWATEGEELFIKHPVIDLILVLVLVSLAFLGHTIGYIR